MTGWTTLCTTVSPGAAAEVDGTAFTTTTDCGGCDTTAVVVAAPAPIETGAERFPAATVQMSDNRVTKIAVRILSQSSITGTATRNVLNSGAPLPGRVRIQNFRFSYASGKDYVFMARKGLLDCLLTWLAAGADHCS